MDTDLKRRKRVIREFECGPSWRGWRSSCQTSTCGADAAIAQAAASALEWEVRVPHDRVSITVEKGIVTLEGVVDWDYQRAAAARVVSRLAGVTGVVNLLHIRPPVAPRNPKADHEAAFRRSAQLDASGIFIEASTNRGGLRGAVNSWRERDAAERIAWAAPGIAAVENELVVRIPAEHTA